MTTGTSSVHLLRDPAALVATWFGVGLLPGPKGTWGTIAALPLAALVLYAFGHWALFAVSLALFGLGLWAAAGFTARHGGEDRQEIVIDEVAGVCLALSVANLSVVHFAIGFALFRLFDGKKPWPVSWGEERPGAMGVMADDMIAGALSACFLGMLVIAGVK
jgi:phosphatidylglycerophosphatase A